MSLKRKMIAFAAVAGMALAAGSAAPALSPVVSPDKFDTERQPMSARDIQAWLDQAGSTNQLPPNCWKEYSPFTGQCIAIICEINGQLVILSDDCDAD